MLESDWAWTCSLLWDFPAVMLPTQQAFPCHAHTVTQSCSNILKGSIPPFLLHIHLGEANLRRQCNSIWEVHLIESACVGFYIHVRNSSPVLELVFCLNEAQQPHLQVTTLAWTWERKAFSRGVFIIPRVWDHRQDWWIMKCLCNYLMRSLTYLVLRPCRRLLQIHHFGAIICIEC